MTLPVVTIAGAMPFAPRISTLTQPFWDALAEGRFLLARCPACARLGFPPRSHCAGCGAAPPQWQAATGEAVVYSHTTVHAAPARFATAAPYALVVLDLVEGVRLVTRWVGAGAPHCGQRVRLAVLRHDDGVLFGAQE